MYYIQLYCAAINLQLKKRKIDLILVYNLIGSMMHTNFNLIIYIIYELIQFYKISYT